MTVTAYLPVRAADLKTLRETLCRVQANVSLRPHDRGAVDQDLTRLSHLIAEIDRHRPLRPDGKHGDLHTPTCGCDTRPANIVMADDPGTHTGVRALTCRFCHQTVTGHPSDHEC